MGVEKCDPGVIAEIPVTETVPVLGPKLDIYHRPERSARLRLRVGAVTGALGGLIGLGGAEFRLPLLIGSGGTTNRARMTTKPLKLLICCAAGG